MYTRHSNVSSGQYLLERGKSLEDLLINVVYKIFGECQCAMYGRGCPYF